MIAMALACDPELVDRRRADHRARRDGAGPGARRCSPTLVRERGVGMMMISHDLSVLADDLRPDRGDVRRPRRRGGPGRRRSSPRRCTRTPRALSGGVPARSATRRSRLAPAGLPGDPPDPRQPARRAARSHPRCPRGRRASAARDRAALLARRAAARHGGLRAACGDSRIGQLTRRRDEPQRAPRSRRRRPSAATGLRVEFTTRSGRVARAVDGVDLAVGARRGRGAGRRVRLRQDDAGPHAARPGSSRPRARSLSTGKPLDYSGRALQGATGARSSSCCRTRPARSTRGTPSTSRSPRACASTAVAGRRARPSGSPTALSRGRAAAARAVLPALPARALRRPAAARA